MSRLRGTEVALALALVWSQGCSEDSMLGKETRSADNGGWEPGGPCGGYECPTGFHCEFDACVPDAPPPAPPNAETRDPLASNRYVFSLEVSNRRLVRVDSSSLEVAAFAAGLAPMDLAVVGGRELSVLLDALDIVEVIDHRAAPPVTAAWTTARSLSHLAVSPTGEHVVAYFDWDDPRAQDRQPEPGNINQVTVLAIEDTGAPFGDADLRARNVAVGFLPRDVRFAADGSWAVVISRDSLTRVALASSAGGVATPEPQVRFDGSAVEIVVDAAASFALMRYAGSSRVDIVALDTGEQRCLAAPAAVTDVALAPGGELLVVSDDGLTHALSMTNPAAATLEPCAALTAALDLAKAALLAVEPAGALAVAYAPDLAVEEIQIVELETPAARPVALEKAVAAVAFAGDGRFALLSHMKAAGTPAWDPLVEDPELSVDKSHGVSWIDLLAGEHRLAVSNEPFGPFAFVPAGGGATFQAVIDEQRPQILRVSHAAGFDDRWIDLAATPLQMGYLTGTERVYVTQSHPWGRVTFIDPEGVELRHVTGFAMEAN